MQHTEVGRHQIKSESNVSITSCLSNKMPSSGWFLKVFASYDIPLFYVFGSGIGGKTENGL